ncbi:ABC transporter ATP-binding protein [Streptomyces sp. SID13666]|uniref:ABC transporter ATP-binding protein n=1 Tax=unclassified Streptomyces TaxID=2593676 RepID=UPI0013C0F34C|nr:MULTISPECIES: ABC transporter ATP-binding protein [unclassified Streptomyces]NEA56271.1 ABC transporter ATP-binding protein [Streptomyces sp. SID13666]NEA76351.1 ABC transporter ATP-binding protein [Streptomyces sp. SID13588]
MNTFAMDTDRIALAPAVRLAAVTKIYGRGPRAVRALDGVSASIPRGSFTAVMGPSGSGKSTFLHCAAGLDTPTSGTSHLGDTELTGLNETQLTQLRRSRVGFVFQAFNLVPALTVRQNIALPLRLAKQRLDPAWLAEILRRVGLAGRADHRPAELSGGQQQRVAIARALITRPDVVFGDEPTGALDTVTAKEILGLLRGCVDGTGQTVVMVTHDPVAASYADTVLYLADGRIAGRDDEPTADRVAERMTHLGAWS